MDNEKTRRFVELTRRLNELEPEVKTIKRERDALQEDLQREFAENGVQRITVDGYTLYVQRQVFAQYDSREDALTALRKSGHVEYIKEDFNHASVSGLVRDIIKGNDDDEPEVTSGAERLPEEWRGLLSFSETFKVKALRS